MLGYPLLVCPTVLQHPIQVATQLPGRGGLRLGLALRTKQMAIVFPDRTGRQSVFTCNSAWRHLEVMTGLASDLRAG